VKHLRINPSWSVGDWRLILQDFQREARLLVTLNAPGHPNIPEIYEYLAESHCLVMKYIEGQSLMYILKRRIEPLPEEEALRYIKDVCSALVYMHSRTPEPVLHRDIKPDNIMLDRAGRVWLIDFGLSKAVSAQLTPTKRHRSGGGGTIGYTPPEQRQSRAEPRSDIYALAATLYTLLTNRSPAQLATGVQGQQRTLPSVRQRNPAVRPEVERLIARHGL
jgi:serine/threonine protein kinase